MLFITLSYAKIQNNLQIISIIRLQHGIIRTSHNIHTNEAEHISNQRLIHCTILKKWGEKMSELLCCDRCGELSIYDKTIYIKNKPICTTCYSNDDAFSGSEKNDKKSVVILTDFKFLRKDEK